jgi:hypothetical protein
VIAVLMTKGFKLIVKKLNKMMMRHKEGEFGSNEDGHWHRLVPSDQQDDESESGRHVCQRFTTLHQIHSQEH